MPIPGGVPHPFLLQRSAADYLYSIGIGDPIEARDEWGVWCQGKVVAVRGEGGWVSLFSFFFCERARGGCSFFFFLLSITPRDVCSGGTVL